jgi:hypothetical protein
VEGLVIALDLIIAKNILLSVYPPNLKFGAGIEEVLVEVHLPTPMPATSESLSRRDHRVCVCVCVCVCVRERERERERKREAMERKVRQ